MGYFLKAIAVVGALCAASTAGASTFSLYNDGIGTNQTTLRATFTCSADNITFGMCNGYLSLLDRQASEGGPDFVSTDDNAGDVGGDLVALADNGAQTEANWINAQLGTSIDNLYVEANKVETSDASMWVFALLTGESALIKIGRSPNVGLISNIMGSTTYVKFTQQGGSGSGLSHYTKVAAVPIPAAGFLLIGGLGGLVALRRRRKAA